jgi:hypothetical protein
MKHLISLLFVSFCCSAAHAQEQWQKFVGLNLTGGSIFDKSSGQFGSGDWDHSGGRAGNLSAVYQMRKNDWMPELSLGYYRVMNQYVTKVYDPSFQNPGAGNYYSGDYVYTNVSYILNARIGVSRYYPTPLPKVAENWYLKGSIGYYFGPNQTVEEEVYPLTMQTEIYPKGSFSFNPEIGLRFGKKRLNMDLALEGHYHSQTLTETTLSKEQQVYSTSGGVVWVDEEHSLAARTNHWGLKMGVYWKFRKREKPEEEPVVLEWYEEREVDIAETVIVHAQDVFISIWDHGGYDADTISLGLNGSYLLRRYELRERKYKFDLPVVEGENLLVMYAHNLGKYPPNTATLLIVDGDKTHKIQLNSNLNTSQGIKIIFAPEPEE